MSGGGSYAQIHALDESVYLVELLEKHGATIKGVLNLTKEYILSAINNQYVSSSKKADARKLGRLDLDRYFDLEVNELDVQIGALF